MRIVKIISVSVCVLILFIGCGRQHGKLRDGIFKVYAFNWAAHTFRPFTKESFIHESHLIDSVRIDNSNYEKFVRDLQQREPVDSKITNIRLTIVYGKDTVCISRNFLASINERTVAIDTCEMRQILKIFPDKKVDDVLKFRFDLYDCE